MGVAMGRLDIKNLENIINGVRGKMTVRTREIDSLKKQAREDDKSTTLGTHLPYALCKEEGIDTTDMTPSEAWEAYKKKTGKEPSEVIKETAEHSPESAKEEETKTSAPEAEKEVDYSSMSESELSKKSEEFAERVEEIKAKDGLKGFLEFHKSEEGKKFFEEWRKVDDERKKKKDEYLEKMKEEAKKREEEEIADHKPYEEMTPEEIDEERARLHKMIGRYMNRKTGEIYDAEKHERLSKARQELLERKQEMTAKAESDEELSAEKESVRHGIVSVTGLEPEVMKKYSVEDLIGLEFSEEDAKKIKKDVDRYYEIEEELRSRTARKAIEEEPDAKKTGHDYQSDIMKAYAKKAAPTKLDTSLPTLSDFQEHVDGVMDSFAEDYNDVFGLDADQLVEAQKNLTEIFNGAEFCMNVNTENLENMLVDHIKNQLETGSSDGYYNPNKRRNISHKLFGHNGDMEDEDYEKYGYLADYADFETTLGDSGPHYGSDGYGHKCCLVFDRDKVADRTTYTVADSLDNWGGRTVPGAVDTNCSIEGLSYDLISNLAEMLAEGRVYSISDIIYETCTSYVEAQYHGRLGASDLSSIRFRDVDDAISDISEWSSEMADIIRENGISIGWYDAYGELEEYDLDTILEEESFGLASI